MVLESKIQAVKEAHGISSLEDWQSITPADVLAVDGVGPVTLDHVRLYLSARNATLLNDMTPEYWKRNLGNVAICHEMTPDEKRDVLPFRIVIDSNEQAPFSFQGLKNSKGREWLVPTVKRRLPVDTGDYQVDGISDVSIEKKEHVAELYSWLGNREEAKKQIENMNGWLRVSFVIIGSSWEDVANPTKFATPLNWTLNDGDCSLLGFDDSGELISTVDLRKDSLRLAEIIKQCERRHTQDAWRSKLHPHTVWNTINSWRLRYPRVHFIAAGSRRLAEVMTFQILNQAFRHSQERIPHARNSNAT